MSNLCSICQVCFLYPFSSRRRKTIVYVQSMFCLSLVLLISIQFKKKNYYVQSMFFLSLVFSIWLNKILLFVFSSRITRFAAIPLSTNSGLIGWVRNCDTIHSLIRDYREKRKILLNIEHRVMLRVRLIL